jgi:hypothetical protein
MIPKQEGQDNCDNCLNRVWNGGECANKYCLMRGHRNPKMGDGLCDFCRKRRRQDPKLCRVGACLQSASEGKGDDFCDSCREVIRQAKQMINEGKQRTSQV